MDKHLSKSELEAFTKPSQFSEDEKRLRDWCKRNASVFLEPLADPWTPAEVALLAMEIGVCDIVTARRVLCHFGDAMAGTDCGKRALLAVYKETFWIEDKERAGDALRKAIYIREKFLRPCWEDLFVNVISGDPNDVPRKNRRCHEITD